MRMFESCNIPDLMAVTMVKKGDFPVLFAERVRRQLLHPKAKKKSEGEEDATIFLHCFPGSLMFSDTSCPLFKIPNHWPRPKINLSDRSRNY